MMFQADPLNARAGIELDSIYAAQDGGKFPRTRSGAI